jgi:hypothetical protein
MTCGSLAEIILDLARGAAVPEPSRRSAARHIDGCPSCAAAYARQRELTAALQALAKDAQEWQAPAAMEERLLAVFAERHGVAPVKVVRARWKYALPAAAAIALAVWGGVRLLHQGEPPTEAFRLKAEATQTTARPANVETGQPQEHGEACCQPGLKTRPPQFTSREPAHPRTADPSSRVALRRDKPASSRPVPAPVEFVRIPSAIGLPEMESGTVLRMQLPLTALPEYGLDIAPDAARTSIEADVLVGQDGQPRAIRLIAIPDAVAPDSRSRQ